MNLKNKKKRKIGVFSIVKSALWVLLPNILETSRDTNSVNFLEYGTSLAKLDSQNQLLPSFGHKLEKKLKFNAKFWLSKVFFFTFFGTFAHF
jgi:outer membrane translocation and assembly module TamA